MKNKHCGPSSCHHTKTIRMHNKWDAKRNIGERIHDNQAFTTKILNVESLKMNHWHRRERNHNLSARRFNKIATMLPNKINELTGKARILILPSFLGRLPFIILKEKLEVEHKSKTEKRRLKKLQSYECVPILSWSTTLESRWMYAHNRVYSNKSYHFRSAVVSKFLSAVSESPN